MQLPPTPSEIMKEFRSRPPGTLTSRPPDPIPEVYLKTKEKLSAQQFCAVWLRAAISMTFFQAALTLVAEISSRTELRRSPSQVSSLKTTVPENINPPFIDGRHTPTRQALRHSRLLNSALSGYRQPIMRNCKFAGLLTAVQMTCGIFLTAFAFRIGSSCSSLKTRDVPIWAGLPLGITGLYSTLFISCCHKDYPGNWGIFIMKFISFTFSSVTVVLCMCSIAFQAVHLETISSYTDCKSDKSISKANCVCRIALEPRDRLYPYDGITCDDVFILLRFYFVITCVASALGGLAAFWFTVLLWGSKYEYVYAGLRPNDDNPLSSDKS